MAGGEEPAGDQEAPGWQGAGLRLAGDEWGDPDAPPVLLLHGAGQTRHSWRATGSALAAAGWHAISLDLRGHGDSERSPAGHYRLDDFAADVSAVSRALPAPPVLVGASLGGLAALVAVARTGDQVPALVLVDISVHVEREGSSRIVRFMNANSDGFSSLEDAAAAIAAFNPQRPPTANLNGLRKNLRRRPDGRWVWHWDPRIMDGGPNSIAWQVPDPGTGEPMLAHHVTVRDAAPSITVPTLLIRGLRSELVSERSVQALHEVIPHATHLDVAEAGHMIVGDRNDAFTAAL
ncbi:MAG TPA: alpha/beta hydrolase, partial [Trebonia sp.]|nr:alpha/beta hydrolase [Trebonia sp.]